jgi:hypothetical protein
METSIKNFLLICAKNAVNAVLLNSGLMLKWGSIFNVTSWSGIIALLQATGMVILAREVAVWLPIVFKWSSTSANPAAELKGGGIVIPPHS